MAKYPAFPAILASCWDALIIEGWRFERTCDSQEPLINQQIFDDLCERYGKRNVAIGHRWNDTLLAPYPDLEEFSIYVRDIDWAVYRSPYEMRHHDQDL